jgi:hypothetical protein
MYFAVRPLVLYTVLLPALRLVYDLLGETVMACTYTNVSEKVNGGVPVDGTNECHQEQGTKDVIHRLRVNTGLVEPDEPNIVLGDT